MNNKQSLTSCKSIMNKIILTFYYHILGIAPDPSTRINKQIPFVLPQSLSSMSASHSSGSPILRSGSDSAKHEQIQLVPIDQAFTSMNRKTRGSRTSQHAIQHVTVEEDSFTLDDDDGGVSSGDNENNDTFDENGFHRGVKVVRADSNDDGDISCDSGAIKNAVADFLNTYNNSINDHGNGSDVKNDSFKENTNDNVEDDNHGGYNNRNGSNDSALTSSYDGDDDDKKTNYRLDDYGSKDNQIKQSSDSGTDSRQISFNPFKNNSVRPADITDVATDFTSSSSDSSKYSQQHK